MRVLRPVFEIPMRAMFHAREARARGGSIALAFIRDDDPRSVLPAFEELADALLGGPFVPSPLHQDIELHAVLIHRPPEVGPYLVDRDEHSVQMPLVTGPGTPATEVMRILLTKLATPCANRFVRDHHTTDEQELFHVAVVEREAEIQPDRVADDLTRAPVVLIGIGRG
jgi:hypothetical protein